MTVNYTTNLALGQPVTGTESGTWGDDVNNAVTSYLDIAIAGGLAVTVTTADVTLTLTQGTSVATNIGSTTAQYSILNVSGAMTAARNLIVPSSSRQYVINNNTTGGFLLTVKGSATTGVTLVNGEKTHVFWNGSDYAKLSNTPGGAGTFSSITNTGLTSGRVVFSTTGGLETDSANLTFSGSALAVTGTLSATGIITSTVASGQVVKAESGTTGILYSNFVNTGGTFLYGIDNSAGTAIFSGSSAYAGFIGTTTATSLVLATNSVARGVFSATGLAVTGALSATGNVTVGNTTGERIVSIISTDNNSFYKVAPGNGATGGYRFNNSAGTQHWNIFQTTGAAGQQGSLAIYNEVSASQVLTLDTSGNLGIGTTSPGVKLDVNGNATVRNTLNFNQSSTTYALMFGNAGVAGIEVYQGIPLTFATGAAAIATEKMRLDPSGNLGLGVTPSAWDSTFKALESGTGSLNGGSFFVQNNGDYTASIATNLYYNAGWKYKNTASSGRYEVYQNTHKWYNAASGTAGNAITFTQAMTLDASGNLLVGTTGLPVANGSALSLSGSGEVARIYGTTTANPGLAIDKSANTNTTAQVFVTFTINAQGTGSGQINANGASQAAFGSFSDSRLKQNIVDLPSQLANIMALRPVEFDYIESEGGGHQTGFIAQEMETIFPDSVGERSDGMKTVTGWNKTEAILIKAIQEQQALITQLTARITALEST